MNYYIRSENDFYLRGFDSDNGQPEWVSKVAANKYEKKPERALENAIYRSGMKCTIEPVVPKTKHEKWAELIASMYEIDPKSFDMSHFNKCVVGHMKRKGWISAFEYNQVCEYLEIPDDHWKDLFSSANIGNSVQDMIKKYQLYVANGFKLS